jgi:hypothetical protein
MTDESNNVLEAKKSIKSHIKFFESLIKHLNSDNEVLKSRAMFAAWCLHRYLNDGLIIDMEKAMCKQVATNDEN